MVTHKAVQKITNKINQNQSKEFMLTLLMPHKGLKVVPCPYKAPCGSRSHMTKAPMRMTVTWMTCNVIGYSYHMFTCCTGEVIIPAFIFTQLTRNRGVSRVQLGTQRCSQRSTSSKLAATTSTFANHIPSNIRALLQSMGPTKGLGRLQKMSYVFYICIYIFISQKASTNSFQLD